MPFRRRSFGGSRGRFSRPRNYIWVANVVAANTLAASTIEAAEIFTLDSGTEDQVLERIRGEFFIGQTPATQAAGDLTDVTFGLIVADQRAFDAGVAALPRPLEEAELEWLWWGYAGLVAYATDQPPGRYYTIDTKARRKIEAEQAIYLVVQNNGSEALTWSVGMRALFRVRGT